MVAVESESRKRRRIKPSLSNLNPDEAKWSLSNLNPNETKWSLPNLIMKKA